LYLTAIRDDKTPPVSAPLKYQIYVWRSKMKVGYFEAMITPMQVIINDLEMMGLENEYGQKKPETDKKTKRIR
jgi:hypothetical protein